jgi:hypothetical protein
MIQWQKIIQMAEVEGRKKQMKEQKGTGKKWSHLTRQILTEIKICSIRNKWTGAIQSN